MTARTKGLIVAFIVMVSGALVALINDIAPSPTATTDSTVVVAPTPKPDTSVPAPTPPPVVNPTPVIAGLSGKQYIGDDFTTYSTTAALQSAITKNIGGAAITTPLYNDGYNGQLAQLDTAVKYNRHATMKYNQPGGVASTPELWVNFPSGKSFTKMWLRAHIRFSPGYTTTGTLANSASAYKVLGWGWTAYNGSGRLEITNVDEYDFYWGMLKSGSTVGGGNHVSPGRVTTEWTDGAWYTYIIEADQVAGVTRLYMGRGDAKPILRASVPGTMNDGSALPPITYVCLGMNFNQVRAATQTQAVWYGDWEVVSGTDYPDPFGVK